MSITLNPDQCRALELVVERLTKDPFRPVRIDGYAGTGKTTLAMHIPKALGTTATFAAYTGKAVNVMRQKGCKDAMTLHSLLYKPVFNPRRAELQQRLEQTIDLKVRQKLIAELAKYPVHYVKRPEPLVAPGGLLIVDEVSMVSEDLGRDILSLRPRLVVLGDPAQLPPVQGPGFFHRGKPDALLTKIERADLTSSPCVLGQAIRESTDKHFGIAEHVRPLKEFSERDLLKYDQVICGRNDTRWKLTNAIREEVFEDKVSPAPQHGEPIMFLRNSKDQGVFNGQIATVLDTIPGPKKTYYLVVQTDEGTRTISVPREGFHNQEGQEHAARRGVGVPATFAYVITAHKAQGSEWDNVLIFVDPPSRSLIDQRRWLYTAVTRAAKTVTVVDIR